MMYRKFIATVLVLAVCITGLSVAPARAGDRDMLKILGGAAAVAILGAAIAKARDRDDDVARNYNYYELNRQAELRRQRQADARYRGHRQGKGHYKHAHKGKHPYKYHPRNDDRRARPLPRRVQRMILPASCHVRAYDYRGSFTGFGRPCLERKFRYVGSLPRSCATFGRFGAQGKARTIYRADCLARNGYTTASY